MNGKLYQDVRARDEVLNLFTFLFFWNTVRSLVWYGHVEVNTIWKFEWPHIYVSGIEM